MVFSSWNLWCTVWYMPSFCPSLPLKSSTLMHKVPNLMTEMLRRNQQRDSPPLARLSWCWWINDSYSESLSHSHSIIFVLPEFCSFTYWIERMMPPWANSHIKSRDRGLGHPVNREIFLLIWSVIWLVRIDYLAICLGSCRPQVYIFAALHCCQSQCEVSTFGRPTCSRKTGLFGSFLGNLAVFFWGSNLGLDIQDPDQSRGTSHIRRHRRRGHWSSRAFWDWSRCLVCRRQSLPWPFVSSNFFFGKCEKIRAMSAMV